MTDLAALAGRRSEWNALVDRSQTNTVFQTFEFHAAWWSVFGSESRGLVLLAEEHGVLVGIAPLMVRDRRVLGSNRRAVQFIGCRSFDYCDFIVESTRQDVVSLLLARLTEEDGFDLLYLRDIPGTSGTVETVRRFFAERNVRIDARILYQAPTRLFHDPVADRQLVNKKSLKRHHNHFKRSGKLEFRHFRTTEEVAPFLERFFEQHVSRRAATDAPSLFRDPRMRRFFRALASSLSATDWLLFTVVLHDDEPIAMHFGFEYGGRIIWYKPAFNMDLAKHSPGEVLIKCLLEYALERQVRELDFTIGEEAFKYRFANHSRPNYAVRVHRRWASYHVSRLLQDARALVERYPMTNRVARKALAKWRDDPWL